MRVLLLLLTLSAFLAGPALAQDDGSTPPAAAPGAGGAAPSEETSPADSKTKLDELFASLAKARSEEEGQSVERQIVRIWLQSGSPTIDLLMRRAIGAMQDKDYPLALDYLDSVTMLKPDYAEGWNKRATVYYLMDDYGQSIADIEHVLALEPRHFGALSGLGHILEDIGEDKRALEVFDRALEIHPNLTEIRKSADKLRKHLGGRDI